MDTPKHLCTAAILTALLAVTGCSSENPDVSSSATASQPSTTSQPSLSASGSAAPVPMPSAVNDGAPTARVDSKEKVASDLDAPWDIEQLVDGSMLISESNAGKIERVRAGIATSLNGPGATALSRTVESDGEGGLLGLALSPTDPSLLYAYISRANSNSVVRMKLTEDLLSAPVDVVTDIPHAKNHNGGRIAFGPDGYLYITTGDSSDGTLAQDEDSLAGKILRVVADGSELDGTAAPGNPFDSLVWSMGHRNVEGLAWAADGRMYASEFGQDSLDELNLIVPGANYGWPTVEGLDRAPAGTALGETVDGLTYPEAQWPTHRASPSGIAITADAIYVAALRGEGVLRIPLTQTGIGQSKRLKVNLGRIRDVAVGFDGVLNVLTNNTDGRGEPRKGDDHVYQLTLS